MSSPTSLNSNNVMRPTWQERLQDHCRAAQMHPPVFNIVSDRRGGRTAWSSTVTIEGQNIAARYWYDGQYVNNAKEDAAEVALQQLTTPQSPHAQMPGQAQAWRLRGYSSVSSG
ncbi:MAG: hypothetical protein M1830_010251 [Pleopsidium flavum]|nr:MAG: hypothetical protein M1830_010251 [Pleopsidium flavum]